MSYPKNPDVVVLKNKYYPQGLKEIDIWNYYQKVKTPFLQQIQNRDLMFEIMVDVNKPVIKRHGLKGKTIRLTPKNYDEVITGRTVAIHSTMGSYENIGIIDIDISPGDGFAWARKTAIDVYDFVMDKVPIIKSAYIKFTGGTSFHIICEFGRKMKIDAIRFLLEHFLRNSELAKVYTIEAKRRPGIPNLDLSPNKYKGNFITLHSLSVLGLRCMEVPYNKISNFNPSLARLK